MESSGGDSETGSAAAGPDGGRSRRAGPGRQDSGPGARREADPALARRPHQEPAHRAAAGQIERAAQPQGVRRWAGTCSSPSALWTRDQGDRVDGETRCRRQLPGMTGRRMLCGGPATPGEGYFFLVPGLLPAALFTADFFGFLVSFFCALLPLAMVSSWRGFYTSRGLAARYSWGIYQEDLM